MAIARAGGSSQYFFIGASSSNLREAVHRAQVLHPFVKNCIYYVRLFFRSLLGYKMGIEKNMNLFFAIKTTKLVSRPHRMNFNPEPEADFGGEPMS